MEAKVPTLRAIRSQGKKICAAAGIDYAVSSTTRIRGHHHWSSGITIDMSYRGLAIVNSTISGGRASAIVALRAAGWTVEDDGCIMALP